MLTTALVNGTNVIRVTWEDAMTPEEVTDLRHQIGFVARVYGDARLLVDVADDGHVEPAAMWEDLKSVGAATRLDRIALVADERWAEMVAGVENAATTTDVEVFPTDRSGDALAWASS